jgi:hypothetical protein
MKKNLLSTLVLLAIFAVILCTNPQNPFDNPDNAKVYMTIKDSQGNLSSSTFVTDTVGNKLMIGVSPYLFTFIDSVTIAISQGAGVDTSFVTRTFTSDVDTQWFGFTAGSTGNHSLTTKGYKRNGSEHDLVGTINIVGRQISLVTQPADMYKAEDSSVTLSVQVSGAGPFTYQWFHNDNSIQSGGTGSALFIKPLALTDSGKYFCVVKDQWDDSVVTSSATLTVIPKAAKVNAKPSISIDGHTSILSTETCSLTVNASDPDSGQTLTFAVLKKPSGSTFISGQFKWTPSAGYLGSDTIRLDTAIFTVTDNGTPPLSDTQNVVIMVKKFLAPPQPQPQTLSTNRNTALQITLAAISPDGDSITAWAIDTQTTHGTIAQANSAKPALIYTPASGFIGTDCFTFKASIGNLSSTYSAKVSIRVDTNNIAPTISQKLAAQTLNKDDSLVLTITVNSDAFPAPLYSWYKAGSFLDSTRTNSWKKLDIQAADSGFYFVIVSNSKGRDSSGAHIAVDVPPAITAQPANQTVKSGTSATFTVVASGIPTPTFQWQKNGVNCTQGSATTASLTINPATIKDTGTYTVIVTNPAGSLTSSGATLTIASTPEITVNAPTLTNDSGFVNEASPIISGTASSEAGVKLFTAQVDGNGVATTGMTNWSLNLSGLSKKAWHSISLTFTDSASHNATKSFQIFFRPTLAKPTSPTLVASTGRTIAIGWTAVASCDRYLIYRSDNGLSGTFRLLKDTVGTSFTDSLLKVNHSYGYRIRGYYAVTGGKFATDSTEYSDAVGFSTKNWFQHIYNVAGAGTSILQSRDSGYVLGIGGNFAEIMRIGNSSDSIWCNSFVSTEGSSLNSIRRTDSDGGLIAAGTDGLNGFVVKTDSMGRVNGTNCWSRSYVLASSSSFHSVRQYQNSPLPGFVATGNYFSTKHSGLIINKCSIAGDSLWAGIYPTLLRGMSLNDSLEDPFLILGVNGGLLQVTGSGDTVWSKKYLIGTTYSFRRTSDNGYLIISDSSITKTNYLGDSLWSKSIVGLNYYGDDSFQKIANNQFVLVGNGSTTEPNDIHLITIDESGVVQLHKIYSNAGIANGVQQTFDGGFIVTGQKNGNVMVFKTDGSGNTGQ